jgi:hypothetical protein
MKNIYVHGDLFQSIILVKFDVLILITPENNNLEEEKALFTAAQKCKFSVLERNAKECSHI